MPARSPKPWGRGATAARPSASGTWAGAGHLPTDRGFDVNIGGTAAGQPPTYFGPLELPGLKLEPGEFLTERLTLEGGRFLNDNRARPWFLYQAHFTVHMPLEARREVIEKYRKRNTGDVDPIYCAMVESADDSVGRLLRSIEEAGVAQRTAVFFFSTTAVFATRAVASRPSRTTRPLRAGKGHLYEGGIREPLMVRWPGVTRGGAVNADPVSSVDFFPTICEMTGAPGRGIDGVSLTPALRGGATREQALILALPALQRPGRQAGRRREAGRLEADRVLRGQPAGAVSPGGRSG